MRLSSVRQSLLGVIAGLLSRWLSAVNARIESAPPPFQPPAPPAGDAPLPPAPPEHWVEMVRQGAPQLLDPEAAAPSGVIDYRADDALIAPAVLMPPFVASRGAKPRPVHFITPQQRQPVPVPTVRTAPKRPLRLNSIATQPLDAETIREHAAGAETKALELPAVRPAMPQAAQPAVRYPADTPADALPERDTVPLPDPPPLAPRIPGLPAERRVREVRAAVPDEPSVPSVRTGAEGVANLRQQRTGVPRAPQQTVLRPTIHQPALNVEDVTPERWASLPQGYDDAQPGEGCASS